MSQEDLQQLLNELRTELSELDTDSETSQELQLLINEIEDKIEELEESHHQHALTDSVQENIVKFEVEHPKITAILNDIMLKLSNMGI